MRWLRPIFSAGETLFDRVLCVIGAVLFSQAPEFMQQYLQRLGGHLAEARRQLEQFETVAKSVGKNLQELAAQYSANSDAAVASMGKVIVENETRVGTLASAEAALRDASVWTRPFVFLRDLDWEITRGTSSVFKPAVPTTIEGALYAAVGLVAILLVYHGLVSPLVSRIFRKSPKAAESKTASA
ncbi:MAG: DUF2937 family protein [Nibricoccus sp.]